MSGPRAPGGDAPRAASELAPRIESGPPWILGHRGTPLEAPENTLSSLRRALEHGLDGVEYDLHACATGEAVLLHDGTLDRTTDAHGRIEEKTLPELAKVSAGAWFGAEFAGEPLPLLDDALELVHPHGARAAIHMIELKDARLVGEVARQLARQRRDLRAIVASFDRGACVEARAHGLAAMLLAVRASDEDLAFVEQQRIDAYGVGPGGWRGAAAAWPCERWAWSVDEPADLLEACRLPLAGFNTNEARRALAVRALVALAPDDRGPYPLTVPELAVDPPGGALGRGEWCGRWRVEASVRNPLAWRARAEIALEVRHGAFDVGDLPAPAELGPGESRSFAFDLKGGSFSPGGDPLLVLRLRWKSPRRHAPAERDAETEPERASRELLPMSRELTLDAPLHRVRRLTARAGATRLSMLREHPSDRPATMVLKRAAQDLILEVEDAGGLVEPRALVRLGGETRRGARGVRMRLPADFDALADGLPFSCGFEGRASAESRDLLVRRWAGGVPEDLRSGSPGRLLPR